MYILYVFQIVQIRFEGEAWPDENVSVMAFDTKVSPHFSCDSILGDLSTT